MVVSLPLPHIQYYKVSLKSLLFSSWESPRSQFQLSVSLSLQHCIWETNTRWNYNRSQTNRSVLMHRLILMTWCTSAYLPLTCTTGHHTGGSLQTRLSRNSLCGPSRRWRRCTSGPLRSQCPVMWCWSRRWAPPITAQLVSPKICHRSATSVTSY